MGEEPGTAGAEMTEGNDPAEIREQIEDTREELGDTVAALAAKADVKGQATQRIEAVKATVGTKKNDLVGKARQASPDKAIMATSRASETARQNPVPVAAAGAFAFGFLAGWAMRR
jgi:replicative DNA helicase